MGNNPTECPISYRCFLFPELSGRLFGLDVDMDLEIEGKRKRRIIEENIFAVKMSNIRLFAISVTYIAIYLSVNKKKKMYVYIRVPILLGAIGHLAQYCSL